MSELPKGWCESFLGDVVLVERGSSPRPIKHFQTLADDGVNWVKIGDAREGQKYIHTTKEKITREGAVKSRFVDVGDFILSNSMSFGRPYIMGIQGYIHDGWFVLRLPIELNADYFYHLLSSSYLKLQFNSLATGGVVKNISGDLVKKASLPIPPLNEQKRIADKLDLLLAKVNAAQAKLEKIPTILKRFRQSVLAAATSGELTKEWRGAVDCQQNKVVGNIEIVWDILQERDIPVTWQWVALGNIAKCTRGKFSIRPRNDPSCFEGVYPFIQIGDLPKNGGEIKSHKQTLNDKGFSVSKQFETGTVVLAIVGATIANTGITTYPVCFPDSLVGINTPTKIGNKYVDFYLRAIKEDIRQASYAGGGQPNIKLSVINPLPLPLPPIEEQTEIVRRVEALFAHADTVEKQYQAAKASVDRLTQSILAKAFRGELVPQDPNDEPAEKLLERIQAARASADALAKAAKKTSRTSKRKATA